MKLTKAITVTVATVAAAAALVSGYRVHAALERLSGGRMPP